MSATGDRRRYTLGAKSRLRAILEGAPPQPVELFNDLHFVTWGLWLLGPWDTFSRNPSYQSMAFAPQWLWGAFGLALGTFGLGALLFDGRTLRILAALMTFAAWLFLALLVGAPTSFATPDVPIHLVRAVAAGWVYVRLERGGRHLR